MIRTIDEWMDILGPVAGDPMEDIAERILDDVTHYQSGRTHHDEDCKQLANAILAWERLGGGSYRPPQEAGTPWRDERTK